MKRGRNLKKTLKEQEIGVATYIVEREWQETASRHRARLKKRKRESLARDRLSLNRFAFNVFLCARRFYSLASPFDRNEI